MTGRPSTYSEEVANEICARIAHGRSVKSICKDKDMPSEATIYVWLFKNPDFQERYARAREAQADVFAEEILDIADTPELGERREKNDKGETVKVTTHDMTEHRKLRIESRKWLMGKLRPKKYGERLDVAHSGTIGVTVVDDIKD